MTLRIALVFFGRKSSGLYFLQLKSPRLYRNWVDDLADSSGLLWAQVQRLVLLALVEFPQVLLLLLVHHDVHAGDGFSDHTDLGELRGSSSSHLSHSELGKFRLEVIELLGQLFLLAITQLRALDFTHG